MEVQNISISKVVPNTGQIKGLPKNPRKIDASKLDKLKASIQQDRALMEARPLMVIERGGQYVTIGGNMRLEACKQLGWQEVPCVVLPLATDAETLKRYVLKDNASFGDWDFDALQVDFDMELLQACDIELPVFEDEMEDHEDEVVARKRKEFEERMQNGENLEEDEEYNEFCAKFEAKKTTDDCYTPAIVYDAVADWVANEYGVSRSKFVRPFYPGGDYQKEKYNDGDIVVDNPPFSILSEILNFYNDRGIKFFLFAPHLTLFSSAAAAAAAALCVGAVVTYENGAVVNTSFLTNLESADVQFRSAPTLYKSVKEANDAHLKQLARELPKYTYDKHVITSPNVAQFSRYGIEFVCKRNEVELVSRLDCQKENKKAIFGKGYLISDRLLAEREKAEREKAEREKAEREKAEREKAEREKAERFNLSDREKEIIKRLNEGKRKIL